MFFRTDCSLRRFLASMLACLTTILANGAALPDERCDVVVVGGGTAGVAAALQSAAGGAKTILVEQGAQVGGTMTSGGINFPGLFHAWGRQVIDGLGYALVTNCVALSGGKLPNFKKPTGTAHWKHQIAINIPLYVALAEEALVQSRVRIHYHAAPMSAVWTNGCWQLDVAAVGDTRRIMAKQVIDCTGNAGVAAMAGFARERSEAVQPGTFVYTIDPQTDVDRLDRELLSREYEKALAEGRVRKNDSRWSIVKFLNHKGNAANYVEDADNSTADLRTETNLRGRASMLRMYRFLRGVKGLENVALTSMSAEVGVRETYRIVGEYRITEEDYRSGRVFPDSLCHAFYPVDMHEKSSGVRPSHLADGIVPTVPLRALVPKGAQNMLVAGRCVSSDRPANSGLRVEAACMAMGQVAGAAAACAALHGTTPLETPLDDIRRALRASGAIVPEPPKSSDTSTCNREPNRF